MNENKSDIFARLDHKDGMTVPDCFFERFAAEMEQKLPYRPEAEEARRLEPTKTTWQRVRAYVYMAAMFAGIWLMMKMFTGIFSVEKGETPDMEMTASATDGSTIEDEWIAYYVDDYTAYEMLYTDSDY